MPARGKPSGFLPLNQYYEGKPYGVAVWIPEGFVASSPPSLVNLGKVVMTSYGIDGESGDNWTYSYGTVVHLEESSTIYKNFETNEKGLGKLPEYQLLEKKVTPHEHGHYERGDFAATYKAGDKKEVLCSVFFGGPREVSSIICVSRVSESDTVQATLTRIREILYNSFEIVEHAMGVADTVQVVKRDSIPAPSYYPKT